ncbi:MAG TPA: hypothetical protein DCK76_00030 [Desulfotomaculum sp.]|nr:hypothetical protein [Desulfotomaculum sp.]HBY03932.1 hypothetical protein [Desulfotomaculum sp.]
METNITPETDLTNEIITKPLNLWQRIAGILWGGPRKTFEDIIAAPKLTGIIILLLGISLLLAILVLPKIKEFTLLTLQNLPNAASMPASAASTAVTAATVAVLAGSIAAPLITWLILAALLSLFNSSIGGKSSFKMLFGVSVYAYLPVMIASIVKTGLIMSSPARNMRDISTSLALFLPVDKINDRLYMFLSQIDPFFIWSLVLLVLGSSLAMKVAFKKTAVYIGALWVLYIIAVVFLSGKAFTASVGM